MTTTALYDSVRQIQKSFYALISFFFFSLNTFNAENITASSYVKRTDAEDGLIKMIDTFFFFVLQACFHVTVVEKRQIIKEKYHQKGLRILVGKFDREMN